MSINLSVYTLHTRKMTPYELRFEIFKQAQKLVEYEFEQKIYDYNLNLDRFYDNKSKVIPDFENKPEFPTFEKILEVASSINKFVSEDKVA